MLFSRTGRTLPDGAREAMILFLMPPAVLTVWGGIFLDLATSGRLRWFLNPLFWPFEIVAGIALLVLAAGYLACFQPVALALQPRVSPRLVAQALVLIVPIVAANCLAPPSFSAAALERRAALAGGGAMVAQSVPSSKTPDHVEIVDLAAASYYPEHIPEVSGKEIDYIGQYFPGNDQEFRFCRVLMSCCAQDATPIYLHIVGTAPKFAEMQWIEVQGQTFFRKDGDDWVPCVHLEQVEASHQPADPYLYPVKTSK
jgi:uncharacterized repeat protein (TIGR03943 family)